MFAIYYDHDYPSLTVPIVLTAHYFFRDPAEKGNMPLFNERKVKRSRNHFG